jgi:hypothetical protein
MENNSKEDAGMSATEARHKGLKDAILECLKETPIIQYAVKKAGTSRSTFYRFCKDDLIFAKAVGEAISEGASTVSDLAQIQLIAAIRDRDMSAIKYWLSHHDKAYAPKLYVTTELMEDNRKLTPEQKTLIEEALKMAGLDGRDATDTKDEKPKQ